MKKAIVTLLMGLGIICAIPKANAREFKEHISKEFTLLLEMDKTITADDEKTLETGKKELRLAFDEKADTIMAYIAEPYDSRPHRNWQYNDDRSETGYSFNVDFTMKVPFGMNLHISTVNDGIISINNVSGVLHVNNVNEEISIKNAKGTTFAHTVNGDVLYYKWEYSYKLSAGSFSRSSV